MRYTSRWRNLRYHLRTAEWETLREYQHSWSGSQRLPWLALLRSSWQHGTSFADYYRYRFFEKTPVQRRSYITTSLRHELTRQLNDPNSAELLKDKACFKLHFADLLGREIWSWSELQQLDPALQPPRLVLKPRWGQQGEGILFPENFASWVQARHWIQAQLQDPDRYVFEAYIVQHPALAALNPSSLNTLRVVTCLQADQVEIWALALRIGTRPGTDNFSNGGLGLEISLDGVLLPPAVKKNPFAPPCLVHPV
ncbi:MAG: hexapeptide transferase, partial [Candidatus Melainabacteria bacterium HGW-Melainabacteria-1]